MRAEKQYLISEVDTHLKKSDYVILANFSKVSVADTAELRKRLAVEKAEFHVVKNSSLRVAAKAIETGEERCVRVVRAPIHAGVATAPRDRIRLFRSDAVDQLAE